MTKFVIDAGNSFIKIAVFESGKIVDTVSVSHDFSTEMGRLLSLHPHPYSCIFSTVVNEISYRIELEKLFAGSRFVFFRPGLRLPIKIAYKTPETLGNDRLANVCGAWKFNSGKNSLVIDCGTCVKYDFITSEGIYNGGSISPGLEMRYKALNKFTGRLPLYSSHIEFPALTGQSTESSMRSGVENGMLEEINGIIRRYRELFDQTDIILTGGDHEKFAGKLKSPIFVAPNLTLNGLKEILDHNDQ